VDRAARARHHAHLERPCAKAQEPSRALFHDRDHGGRPGQPQRLQTLANRLVQCLAFEYRALWPHNEPLPCRGGERTSCCSACGNAANQVWAAGGAGQWVRVGSREVGVAIVHEFRCPRGLEPRLDEPSLPAPHLRRYGEKRLP
jgi:hypothetical protein